jgi:glycosyltransferase involved in cell wall biosynthesis
MKIVYLHQYFVTPEMIGGTRSYEMARRLVAAGHEVHMVTTDQRASGASQGRWRMSMERGIQVHWLGVAYGNHMRNSERIAAFLRFALGAARRAIALRGDVIFATSTPLTVAIPAILASFFTRTPYVFEVRDMWPDVPIAIGALRHPLVIRAARLLERLAYGRARRVVALAPGMRDDILAKGVAADKVTVIPNGCDLDVFGTTPDVEVRGEYAWLGERKLVLFAGTFGAVNGVEYIVHLAKAVKARDPEMRFVIIGHGGGRDSLLALAEHEGLLHKTVFVLDAVPKVEVARWLHSADMVLALFTGPRAVWKDAVQNKFFDALAAGKPVACNFDGWQTRIALEYGVGIHLSSTDHAAAAAALLDAMQDREWNARAVLRAQELSHGRFNRDRLAGELAQLLQEAAR